MRNRQSIRLKGYDYSKAGMYFITICTYNDENLFGEIIDGIIEIIDNLNKGGIDEGVINNARTSSNLKIMRDRQINNNYSEISPKSNSLSIIIRSYKSCVTRKIRYRRGVIHNALKKQIILQYGIVIFTKE